MPIIEWIIICFDNLDFIDLQILQNHENWQASQVSLAKSSIRARTIYNSRSSSALGSRDFEAAVI